MKTMNTLNPVSHFQRQILSAGLADFGLNPREWRIKPIDKVKFKIISRKERSLSLVGETTNRLIWQSIELNSI